MGLRKLFLSKRSSTCVLFNRFETGPKDFLLLFMLKWTWGDMCAGVQAVLREVLEELLAGSYGADAMLEGKQHAKKRSD